MTTNQNQNGRMSLKKKLLITLGAVVGVVAIVVTSVLGTLAYLTSSAAVSNVFTIGNVGITMTESKVNPDGTLFDGGATQVDTNTYHLLPGKTYVKDPVITVSAGSTASYLFVLLRNDLEQIAWNDTEHPSIAQQMADNGWAKYTKASTGWVYVFVGFNEDGTSKVPSSNVVLESGKASDLSAEFVEATKTNYRDQDGNRVADKAGKYALFNNFSIKTNADVSTYGAAKVTLTAVAIQADGFTSDEPGTENAKTALDKAWEAVIATYPYIHTGGN